MNIVLKRKTYSEGKNTKKVRKETDKKDKIINTTAGAVTGAAGGGLVGSFLGKPELGAAIGAGVGAARSYLGTREEEKKRKNLPESKHPTEPEEVKHKPSAARIVYGVGAAGAAGEVAAREIHKTTTLKKAEKGIKKLIGKIEAGTATEREKQLWNELSGRGDEFAAELINRTKKQRKIAGHVGGAVAASAAALSIAHNLRKAHKLEKAYKKDKENDNNTKA